MKYGNASRGNDLVSSYIGTNPANDNYTFLHDSSSPPTPRLVSQRDADLLHFWQKVFSFSFIIYVTVSRNYIFLIILNYWRQRYPIFVLYTYFDIFFQYNKAPAGSHDKLEAKKRLVEEISYRKHVEYSINHIGMLLFGNSNSSSILLDTVPPPGQPLVDDWDCFKMLVGPITSLLNPTSAANGVHHATSFKFFKWCVNIDIMYAVRCTNFKFWILSISFEMKMICEQTVKPVTSILIFLLFFMQVTTYEKYCGSLSKYGMKYMRAIANMCNVGVTMEMMAAVSIQTCSN